MHDEFEVSPGARRYIDSILRRVTAPAVRKDSLRADLEGHFREAAEQGEEEWQVIRRLGTPQEVAAAFMANVELRVAGFWERLVAFLGDIGLGLVALVPFVILCILLAQQDSEVASPSLVGVALIVGIAATLVSILYFPLLEYRFGKTYGKHLMKLRVVSEDGAQVSLGAAFIRRLSLFFELLWLDALFIPFTERKQRAFDMVARTLVVHEPGAHRQTGSWLLCLAPWLLTTLALAILGILFYSPS